MSKFTNVDLGSVKNVQNEKKNNEYSYLTKEEMVYKNEVRNTLLSAFSVKYKLLLGEDPKFRKEYTKTVNINGEDKIIPVDSDKKRLEKIFTKIMTKSKDTSLCSRILALIMVNWSEWDKAAPNNLIGFLENAVSKDIGIFLLRARNGVKKSAQSAVLDEGNRIQNVDKQRKLFAQGA